MTHILVHPQEVATYGIQATAHFGTIVDQLAVLTNMINDVVFEGEAAFQFRTETGTLITDFNKQINDSMVAMVTNVQNAVGNIQASMQGTRVVLTIPEPRMGPKPTDATPRTPRWTPMHWPASTSRGRSG